MLPGILIAVSVIATTTGVGSAVHGAKKVQKANSIIKDADKKQKQYNEKIEWESKTTSKLMDDIGKRELEILLSFRDFSDMMEKIQNRPQFQEYKLNTIKLPQYEIKELQKISSGAKILLGGLSGAAVGTAGGFAASGAISSTIMVFGTASTGTAISSLSGVAATNATLAALGGGSLAAGGGGMALGSTVLGVSTLGIGIMVGGVIFNVLGSKLSKQAKKVYVQVEEIEKETTMICNFLSELNENATIFHEYLKQVEKVYKEHLKKLNYVINAEKKTDWNRFSVDEKQIVQNTALLVGLLYKMCKVKMVLVGEQEDSLNVVNKAEMKSVIEDAKLFLKR